MSVVCPYCGKSFGGDKLNARHLSKCNPSKSSNVEPCLCGHISTSLTQMKRHRKTCSVWQTRDKKLVSRQRQEKTLMDKYGVSNVRSVPELEAKRKKTIQDKYGADNVFCRESLIFEQVQESLVGKRKGLQGKENPFSWESTKDKIKAVMRERYGVDHPQQALEIQEKTKKTNLERYGCEYVLASPNMRDRIKETCHILYGGPAPSCSPQVLEKQKHTNEKRWGVPWTCLHPGIRQKQLDTMQANWGTHFFSSKEGQAKIRAAMKKLHGVQFPGSMEGHWVKAKATFQERYGVDHPLQLIRFNQKRFDTCRRRYGTPFPGRSLKGPNKLEQRVWDMVPDLLFTGDGRFWKYLPLLQAHKNPDFIIPGEDPQHPFRGVTKVIEVFGDYWHSKIRTGKTDFEHENELIAAFADIGIRCLVVWEGEIHRDPATVVKRLHRFLGV